MFHIIMKKEKLRNEVTILRKDLEMKEKKRILRNLVLLLFQVQ